MRIFLKVLSVLLSVLMFFSCIRMSIGNERLTLKEFVSTANKISFNPELTLNALAEFPDIIEGVISPWSNWDASTFFPELPEDADILDTIKHYFICSMGFFQIVGEGLARVIASIGGIFKTIVQCLYMVITIAGDLVCFALELLFAMINLCFGTSLPLDVDIFVKLQKS